VEVEHTGAQRDYCDSYIVIAFRGSDPTASISLISAKAKNDS